MNAQLTADQHHAIDHVEAQLHAYYRKHNPSYLTRAALATEAAPMVTIAKATYEADGWRGQIIDANGNVLTRTLNLYPTSDKAIDGAKRLWDFKQQQPARRAGAPHTGAA